jgi:soluble lytic murein transglycosylase
MIMKPSTLALIFLLLGAGGPAVLDAKTKTQPSKAIKKSKPAKANSKTTFPKSSEPKTSEATLPVTPYALSGKGAEGLLAYTKGDYTKAAAALAEYRKSNLTDEFAYSLGYLEARSLLALKKKADAQSRLEALAAKSGALQSEVFYLLGELYEAQSAMHKAQDAFAKVERGSRRYDEARLAQALMASTSAECDTLLAERFYWTKDRARALGIQQKFAEKSGDADKAQELMLVLFREYPMTTEGDAVFEAVLAQKPKAEDIFARLSLLLEKKKATEARAMVHSLEQKLGVQSAIALEATGDLAYQQRNWKEAISFFEKAQAKSQDPWRAMRRQANALSKKGDTEDALALYKSVYESKSIEGPQALLDAARLLRDKDRLSEARELAKQAYDSNNQAVQKEALWVSGWLAWRQKDFADAVERFDALVTYTEKLGPAEKEEEELERRKMGFHLRERALYWSARAYAAQGLHQEAVARYETIVKEYPLSYYSHQSFDRLKEANAKETIAALRVRQQNVSPLLMQPNEEDKLLQAPKSGFTVSDDPSVRAALAFYGLGLMDSAIDELKSQANQGTLSTDGGALLGALALNEEGIFQGTWTMLWKWDFARYPGEHAIQNNANSKERLVELGWKIAYPKAYGEIVEQYAKKFDVPSEMVFSIMRAESTFRPEVVSPANAVGLTQVLPTTANWIAKELLKIAKPSRSQLFDEDTNLQLGSRFMKELVTLYKGNYALAIASYNAGPGAGMRWYKRWKDLSTDELIEEIPYNETHGYTKKVLGSMGAYRYVWGDWSKEETRSLGLNNKLPETLGTYNGKQM